MESHRLRPPVFELMHAEHYTPEEVADLLELGLDVVRHAAFAGELPAQIVNHDIVSIRRADVLTWLEERNTVGHDRLANRHD